MSNLFCLDLAYLLNKLTSLKLRFKFGLFINKKNIHKFFIESSLSYL